MINVNEFKGIDEDYEKVVSILGDCKAKKFWGDIELKIQNGQIESIKISQVVKNDFLLIREVGLHVYKRKAGT